MIQEAIRIVVAGEDLSRDHAHAVMNSIMEGDATPAQIAAFLIAEKLKGETYHEVAGFASAMRDKATPVHSRHANAIDMCGTGGDGAGTFNISTVASFVVAAGGVPVAKHGNRSVSSKCGSADLLEALGVNIELSAQKVGTCLDEIGIGFLFAPALHKAMKHAVGPRREIGVRTVFNILGPLTNPAAVRRQVLGVFDADVARLMAKVLRELGADHILIVHSDEGLDEVSIYGPTLGIEVKGREIREQRLQPEDFGLTTTPGNGAHGGTPRENAHTARQILAGESGPARDFVVANAACGFVVGGLADMFVEGAEMAREQIDCGAARAKLAALKEMSHDLS